MLVWISSHWHSEHWAEITLCYHHYIDLHNALFLLYSRIPLVCFSSKTQQAGHYTNKLVYVDPLVYFWSHTLLQTYGTNLPTSLTYFLLFNQRFLTLETCCGYWYGLLSQFFQSLLFHFGFYDIIISIIIINYITTHCWVVLINSFPFFTFFLIDLFSKYSK